MNFTILSFSCVLLSSLLKCSYSIYLAYLPSISSSGSKKKTKALVLSLSLLSGVSVIGLIIGLYILIKTRNKKRKMTLKDDLELPLFSLSTVTKATSNFSDKNMLGEGGFGSVYKVTYSL